MGGRAGEDRLWGELLRNAQQKQKRWERSQGDGAAPSRRAECLLLLEKQEMLQLLQWDWCSLGYFQPSPLAGSSFMADALPHAHAPSVQPGALAVAAVVALHHRLQEREWQNLGLEAEPEIGKPVI